MRRIPYLILILCTIAVSAFSQGEIPVDLYTGTPSISIPIATVSSIDVSQPVSLSYSANALQQSWYGLGWNLQAGGSISREVRGLPDDFGYGDTQTPPRKGWRFAYGSGTVASDVGGFTPASDTLATSYGSDTSTPKTGEPKDYYKLSSADNTYSYNDLIDTEPDVFNYSVGGISGKFVFGNDLAIRTIPYRDIKIEPTYVNYKITSFKITTNDGYIYTFGLACAASKRITGSDMNILTTDYKFYNNAVAYNTEWMLTEVKSPSGNTITYTYTSGEFQPIPDEPVSITMYRKDDNTLPGSLDYIERDAYKILTTRERKIPATIVGSTGSIIEFAYNTTDKVLETITLRDTRKGTSPSTQFVKSFTLAYIPISYLNASAGSTSTSYMRWFLNTLTETSGCDKMLPYKFSYNATNTKEDLTGEWSITLGYITLEAWLYYHVGQNEVNYPTLYVYPYKSMKDRYRLLSIPGDTAIYYKLDGTNKSPAASILGSLQAITFPTGGKTTFQFERQRYHDSKSNSTLYAEGLRIKAINYWDGTGNTPITKSFDYTDAAGKSSGKILRKPIYHIPAFQWRDLYLPANLSTYESYSSMSASDRYKKLTIRMEWNIAPADADNEVGYTRVKVSRSGSGYAIHEFQVPATYGQNVSGMWKTPETVFARQPRPSPNQNTPVTDMAKTIFPSGGTWRYPNAPNPFYDYARGLPWKVSDYSESGKRVKEVITTYQNLYKTDTSAVKVYGIKYDRFALAEANSAISNNRIYLLSQYFLLTDADRVPLRDTVKLYDVNDVTGTKVTKTITEYTYRSTEPKQLAQVKRTTPDGNIYRTKFKYPKDYANQSSGEIAVQTLNTLASYTAFRHGVPIETVSTLQKPSGAELVTGASVVKYGLFNGVPMPQSQWVTELDAPISGFIDSYIINLSGTFKIDDRYYKQQSAVLDYKATGVPTKVMSAIARDSAETAYAYGNSLPVAKAIKITSTQSAFCDFDNVTDFSFSYSTPYLSTGRSGTNAYYPSVVLYKNFTRVLANNYIVSFWIKSNSSVNFKALIKNTAATTTYQTVDFTVPSTASVYTYVQQIIPLPTSLVAESIKSLRVELFATGLSTPGSSGFTAGLLPVIDDVFFFPEGSHMESYTYQIPYGVASITTGTGDASYIEYDGLGRERLVRNRNGDIVRKNTYILAGNSNRLSADFTGPAPIYVDASATFRAPDSPCAGTVTYEWEWAAGSGFVGGTKIQAHTFTSTGTKTVSLRVSAAGYQAVTKTMSIEVYPVPITGGLCAEGVAEFNGTTATVTTSFGDCTDITVAPPTWRTTFKVTGLTGCEGGCTYRWVRRDFGVWQGVTVGTNSNQYTCEKIVTTTNSFQVFCEVLQGTTVAATLGPIDVIITHP